MLKISKNDKAFSVFLIILCVSFSNRASKEYRKVEKMLKNKGKTELVNERGRNKRV